MRRKSVDEAQFLTNLYEFCKIAADEHDKIVLSQD